jgi:hypothetical protein
MVKNINVRFFSYCIADNEPDIIEISESQFLELKGAITYERHTVFNNGCSQICLTIEPVDYPENYDLKGV